MLAKGFDPCAWGGDYWLLFLGRAMDSPTVNCRKAQMRSMLEVIDRLKVEST
jgi:hypothetical protein